MERIGDLGVIHLSHAIAGRQLITDHDVGV
jgi:hypothetical protein